MDESNNIVLILIDPETLSCFVAMATFLFEVFVNHSIEKSNWCHGRYDKHSSISTNEKSSSCLPSGFGFAAMLKNKIFIGCQGR
jgi:hypothetical protein